MIDGWAILELTWRALAAAALIACTAFTAFVGARRIVPRASLFERSLATVIVGLWLSTAGFHLLASLHAFTLPVALAGCGVLAMLARRWASEAPRQLRRELRAWRRIARAAFRGRQRLWVWAFALCSLPVISRAWFLPPMAWDTLTYHALKAGMWVQNAGALDMRAPGTWFFYGPRFAGASLITSWVMLPFHSDLLATGVEALHWSLLGLAVWSLARLLGAREPFGSAAAGFVLALPTIRVLIGSGYDEPLMCLCYVAGCTFALRFAALRQRGHALLAFAAIALTVGMKLTFVRSSAVVVVFLCIHVLRSGLGAKRTLLLLLAGLGSALVVIAPWCLQSIAQTGLPLSPLPVKVLGVALGEAPPEMLWYLNRPEIHESLTAELGVLRVIFGGLDNQAEVPTLLALLPLLLAPLGSWVGVRKRGAAVAMLALCMLADVWTYASSELLIARLRWPRAMSRYVLITLLLATVLSVLWSARWPAAARIYVNVLRAVSLFALCLFATAGLGSSTSSAFASLGAVLAVCVVVACWRGVGSRERLLRLSVRGVLVLGLLLALTVTRSALRYDLYLNEFAVHRVSTHLVPSAQLLDDRTQPRRIAVTGGPTHDMDTWLAYPFLGEHLQNQLLYVSPVASGETLHFGSLEQARAIFDQASPVLWLKRLRAARITHVVSFDPVSVELLIMNDNPQTFRRISSADEQDFGIFELLPPRKAR